MIGRSLDGLSAAIVWSAGVLRACVNGEVRKYARECLRQAEILVRGSLVVIFALALALGLSLGVQGVYTARQLGAPTLSGAIAGLINLRELAPYAFAYMMAAKVSTGYAAELGTMRIADEIDAMDVMGIRSRTYLASTRVVAVLLVVPAAYALALTIGYLGSYYSVVIQIGEVSQAGFLDLFWKFQNPTDFLYSVSKAALMAVYVVLVGCFMGYHVRGGPVEVGRAAATTMLVNLVGIHFIGMLTSEVFWGGNPNIPIGG